MKMRLSDNVIDAAFNIYAEHYESKRGWSIKDRVENWILARKAFEEGSNPDFEILYDDLRNNWLVFRSKNFAPATQEKVWGILDSLPADLRHRRLRDFAEPTSAMLHELWDALTAATEIKQNKNGPSLVALSKFLHFWNPRLFVITDREYVWDWALEHVWLWDQVKQVRAELKPTLPRSMTGRRYIKPDLMDYLAFLVWCGRVLLDNPGICRAFANYVQERHKKPVDLNIQEYEGAAIELLLLGLVELAPAGITNNP